MKIAHAEAHVLSSQGLEEKQAFKIRTNAHAFRLLSSGLYSDKIAAVIREIGCNAHDAHIAAGKALVPFDVKLPNPIDNQFYIRDYGTGLSHEEVMNLYTTYFASTKQESNDFTGAFGLGSKSPFSYTDSFTITSRHGGSARVYSAHIGNDGAPNIAKMGESPCGDDTGIEISFPVGAADFSDFRQRAQLIYQYFDPLPKIIGSQLIQPLSITNDFGAYAFVVEEDSIQVKMGNVCYPVDVSKLSISSTPGLESYLGTNMSNLRGVLLRFKIGDVQVAASREELQYDDQGKAFIKSALKEVIYQIARELETKWKTTLSEDTLENRIAFYKLSEVSARGFYPSVELFLAAGIAQPEKLYEALKQRYERLPDAPSHLAKYDFIQRSNNGHTYAKPGTHLYYGSNIGIPTIVYGTAPHARDRVKKALRDGDLDLPVLLVTPVKKEKGTAQDVTDIVDILVKRLGKLTKLKLEDLDAPVRVGPKLKKGQLPSLPQALLDIKPTVYVNEQVFNNWGRSRTFWLVGDSGAELSSGVIGAFETYMATLKDVLPIKPFARLTKMQMIRYRIAKRPEWRTLKEHMTELLSSPASIDALKTAVGSFKFRLDLNVYRSESAGGLLENLIYMADQQKDMYQGIEVPLKKYDLKDTIDAVLKNSKTAQGAKPLALVQAYKGLAETLDIKINVPEFDAPMIEINKKFPAAAQLPWRVYKDLWTYAPDRLPDVLDQLLKKG